MTVTMFSHLVLLFIALLSPVSSRPFQCDDLQPKIPQCNCEARMFKGEPINSQVVINCRQVPLSTVPTIEGPSVHMIYEMTLAQNNIEEIPAAAFNGLKIERLDLRKNRLTIFRNDSFQGLEDYLKEIYLGADTGAEVAPPVDSLVGLDSLKTVHMEYFKFPQNGIDLGLINHLHITSLTLKHNKISFIEEASLPAGLTSLTLDNEDLSSFPLALESLTELETLTITNTQVSSLYTEALKNHPRLTLLDLSDNELTLLEPKCFDGVTTSLQTLSLQNNKFPLVTSLNEIQHLRALTTLWLSSITLSSVPPAATFLLNKESLISLHLDGNQLTTLDPSVFNLANLEELNLANNQFDSLDEQAFAGLPSLKSLDLGHQPPGQNLILPASLTALSSLETLKLSKSQLSPANLWARISPMNSLKVLYLDDASLSSLPNYAFRTLTQLQDLNLDGNRLTEVTQEMLAGPRDLITLSMKRNLITKVDRCVFYGFTFPPAITFELSENRLNCDCELRWLREAQIDGTVIPAGDEKCTSPANKANMYLINIQPTDLTCISPQPEEPCLELYTTTIPPTSSPIPNPIQSIQITNVSTTSIMVQWSTADASSISHIKVQHLNLKDSGSTLVLSDNINRGDTSYTLKGLEPNTQYSVCILAFFFSGDQASNPPCDTAKTNSDAQSEANEEDSNVGIIVGTIVGVVVLLAIIAAIVYLMCWRRRQSKDVPAEAPPHVFTASELPSMTSTSRQFTKPKKEKPKVGRALDDSIQVTVISDGRAGPNSPRHSAGSYQFLDQNHPNPNPNVAPHYSDVASRALPSAPNSSLKGHYNGGVQSSSPHHYNEIGDK